MNDRFKRTTTVNGCLSVWEPLGATSKMRPSKKYIFPFWSNTTYRNISMQFTLLDVFTSYRTKPYFSYCLIIRSFSSEPIVFFKFSLKTAREIGTTLLVSCGKLIHVVERRTHRQDGGAYTGKVTRVGFAFEISFW